MSDLSRAQFILLRFLPDGPPVARKHGHISEGPQWRTLESLERRGLAQRDEFRWARTAEGRRLAEEVVRALLASEFKTIPGTEFLGTAKEQVLDRSADAARRAGVEVVECPVTYLTLVPDP